MENTSRTINLIPENYIGDYRKAPGYNWANLVMGESGVDREKSVPGEDMHIGYKECLDKLVEEFGMIAVRDDSGYGWAKNNAVTTDGREVQIGAATRIATINGMWCGGPRRSVFLADDTCPPVVRKRQEADLVVLDVNRSVGYCDKCDSWCFGDCQASEN